MAFKQALQYDTIRSLDTSTASSYASLGSELTYPTCIVKIINVSNKDLIISVDGTNDVDYVPAGSFVLYDITTNAVDNNILFIPANRQYYAKTSDGAAGTGKVYLISLYTPTV